MRAAIRNRIRFEVGEHVGLAYTTLAPVAQSGKVDVEDKDPWLQELAAIKIASTTARSPRPRPNRSGGPHSA